MTPLVSFYNNWKAAISDVALRSATLNITLHDSSYSFAASHSVYADLTGELATEHGYTNGGQALTGVTWSQTGGVATLNANSPVWNVTGDNLVVRRVVLRAVGTYNSQVDPLILSILLDSTPADVTIEPGNPLTLVWNASGILTLG